MPPTLSSARKNHAVSALIARRAAREARKVEKRGASAVAAVVVAHQLANVRTSDAAVSEMLAEQNIEVAAEALLNSIAFTTSLDEMSKKLEQIDMDWQFDRLVESLVQDSARAAESVAVAVRPNIRHVRFVSPPCCSRCAVLAGREYRFSAGFERHPGCDCSLVPTSVSSPYRQDPEQLVADGLVRGLSKADMQALADGADLNQVVNVRLRSAGLWQAGETALRRGSRPTPAGIYARAGDDRDLAVSLLGQHGYIR
ncbi:hypothetical protein J2X46_002707 [Nocardioides sp. BE266]|uniref:hypothetical protein n=1 Tax=Nocardioides sp. BE266 TaxID=2817725 RepID=UPI00285A3B93|nr:hypothetical protein [Nocardioides sp. BE266]MDR7253717.1 hypothetical protein [Nocardioides sp. BE266]